jgi:hypothetical protein
MPPIHHRLAEAVEAGLCWGLAVGFRFFLARLLFLDIETPFQPDAERERAALREGEFRPPVNSLNIRIL